MSIHLLLLIVYYSLRFLNYTFQLIHFLYHLLLILYYFYYFQQILNQKFYLDFWGKMEKVNIFGKEFVENNKDNIELIINGIKCELSNNYKLEYGENNIQIIIKNKISNLENMFYKCKSLKNIEGLNI